MRISDWSSDVCSSDLTRKGPDPRDMSHDGQVARDDYIALEDFGRLIPPDLGGNIVRIDVTEHQCPDARPLCDFSDVADRGVRSGNMLHKVGWCHREADGHLLPGLELAPGKMSGFMPETIGARGQRVKIGQTQESTP